jgi:hypothetical protein
MHLSSASMDIIGHDIIRRRLSGIASAGILPQQAFLFTGPTSVGKTLVANEFAGRLLGMGVSDPEGMQDFLVIRPEDGEHREKRIPVESIRDAKTFLSRFPAEARRRVVLVEHAELLSEQAQNALLKTFEEPNGSSAIILVSSRFGNIKDTILSRSFRVVFPLVSEEDVRNGAIRLFGDQAASSLEPFFFALGRPGVVVSALTDPKVFARRRDALRSLFRLSALSFRERLDISETLSKDLRETAMLFEWWATGLRSMRKDERDPRRLRSYYTFLGDIEECVRSFRDTNANARLLIDRLFLSI